MRSEGHGFGILASCTSESVVDKLIDGMECSARERRSQFIGAFLVFSARGPGPGRDQRHLRYSTGSVACAS